MDGTNFAENPTQHTNTSILYQLTSIVVGGDDLEVRRNMKQSCWLMGGGFVGEDREVLNNNFAFVYDTESKNKIFTGHLEISNDFFESNTLQSVATILFSPFLTLGRTVYVYF